MKMYKLVGMPINLCKHIIYLFVIVLIFQNNGYAQINKGFKTINYSNEQNKLIVHNWHIEQDNKHIMFFANALGVVAFNGFYWQLIKIPNNPHVRSLLKSEENIIYVGAQNDFGTIRETSKGYHYESLLDKFVGNKPQFNDIWEIVEMENHVLFREPNQIFLYHKEKDIKILKPEGTWTFMGKMKESVVAQDSKKGLLKYTATGWKKIIDNEAIANSIITGIVPYHENEYLISTQDEGLFLLKNGIITRFKPSTNQNADIFRHVYTIKKLKNGNYLMGTISHGLIRLDSNANILDIWNKKNGLLSNNIRYVYEDHEQNIWMAMENGISYVSLNSPLRYLITDPEKESSGYSAIHYNNHYWFGTSDAVYKTKSNSLFETTEFERIPNTEGQVWNLQVIQNQLLLSHDKGLFNLSSGEAKKLYGNKGTWRLVDKPDLKTPFVIGTYTGIQMLNQLNDIASIDRHEIVGNEESIRFLVYDSYSSSYWASHPFRGIYQFYPDFDRKKLSKTILYKQKDGLPDDFHNYIFQIDNELLIGTLDGIYLFSNMEKKIIPHPILHKYTKNLPIQFIGKDPKGNLWISAAEKVLVLEKQKDEDYILMSIPELNDKTIGGFASINLQDLSHVLIGVNKGFIHLDFLNYRWKKPLPFFNKIVLPNTKDTLLAIPFETKQNHIPKLSYHQNALHFEFGTLEYTNPQEVEFSYMLEGFDKDFSNWSTKSEKDYTNLPAGKYTFIVKSRFGSDAQSEHTQYSFQILPPWYKSNLAYLIYFFCIAYLSYIFFKRLQKKYTLKHEQQQQRLQLELETAEKEVIKLKNEKLISEVDYKNKELSAMTLHMIKRSEVLNKLKTHIKDASKEQIVTKETLSALLRMIRTAEKSQDEYNDFNKQFFDVNRDLFEKLQQSFPELTTTDLKLCALLKMDLSTKEIAQILNNSTKAVEIGRYRLRKKLGIDSTIKIQAFLNSF